VITATASGRLARASERGLFALLVLGFFTAAAWGQVTASMTGTVKDASGAVISGAKLAVKNLESGLTRTAETEASGSFTVSSLPVGEYEVRAEKEGFQRQVRSGITLAVGQQAALNLTLEVGNVEQQVTVTAAAPLVNTTLSPTSGLVGEKEVKDLPLNGRSFDLLLSLNTGISNYSSNTPNKTARPGNAFSVAGRRPEENRFLMNGVDYLGSVFTNQAVGPYGASGQLLGVDAVREFNLVQHTYGVEYGKGAGGQVSIVTTSGTNQLHGSAFEYLRNSVLDARNFFDPGGVPPFKRNQFGGALGGPLKRDKLFLFGNYEGFRQRLGLSSVAFVPNALARRGFLPIGPNDANGRPTVIQVPNLKTGMLGFFALWPEANDRELGGGVALNVSNPVEKIREDFGLVRFDYNMSTEDSFSAHYLIDDGEKNTPAINPIFININPARSQLLGLQETHIFSPTVLNVATIGVSRGDGSLATLPTVSVPANLSFISGVPPGVISIGGGAIGGSTASATITASGTFKNTRGVKTAFSWSDDLHITKGQHSLSAGLWIQRVRQNTTGPAAGNPGSVSYSTLQTFLQDIPTQFIGTVKATPLGFRTTLAAWYVQDEIKLKPNLSLRLGLRDEMTTGWNEHTGRCANYIFDANGIIITDPLIGPSCLTQNNALALWQPRVGLAWDPTGTGTWAVRAGVGIYNDLQDTLGFRLLANPPFNARVTLTDPILSFIPIPDGTPPPPSCNAQLRAANQPCSIFSPSSVDPNMHTPTVQEWSFTVERGITKDLMFQLGYVGSQAYHLLVSMDRNSAHPQVCGDPAGCVSGGIRAANQTGRVPQGTTYMPSTPGLRPNPFVSNDQSWFFVGPSSYHGLNVSLVKRATHGLTFKANYTFAKALDLNSAVASSAGENQPQAVMTAYDLKLSKGVAAFSLKHQFNANFSYELPFGHGQRWGSASSAVANQLIGGWQWNGIFTSQSGFPFTLRAGANMSGTGDTTNPDTPNRNPAFNGPVIVGKVNQWFNPTAFSLPIPGTFGNVARGSFTGPGLTTFDTSLFKKFRGNERWSVQFRGEVFNIFNHANFGEPNQTVFSGNNISPSAGVITSTTTTSREVQFALKLIF